MKNELAVFGGEPILKKPLPQYMAELGREEIIEIKKVMRLKKYSVFTCPKITEFEKEFSHFIGGGHGIAMSSCTAALQASLQALGIGPKDEVIVPVYTYAATAMAVSQCGAKPVFVDIEKNTYTINPNNIKAELTKKTKAIIPVHLFGQPAEMHSIIEIAEKHNLKVVEDCAQAIGAKYKSKKVGLFGDIGCFSFQETKNITTGGEGGMAVTKDKELEEKIRIIAHEGEVDAGGKSTARINAGRPPLNYVLKGNNFRLSAIQAAIGLAQLKKLSGFIEKRNRIAKYYNKELEKALDFSIPRPRKNCFHAFNNYPLEIIKQKAPRDFILGALNAEGIPAYVYYPVPLNETLFFNQKNKEFKVAKKFCENQLFLPLYPSLKKNETKKIIEGIKKVLEFVT